MKNHIKTFVKNHDVEIAASLMGVSVVGLAAIALYQTGRVIAVEGMLAERRKPLNFTFTDEFIDKLYKLDHED